MMGRRYAGLFCVVLGLAACGDNRIHGSGDVGVTLAPATGLMTTEAGGTATLTIVLTARPSDDVTIPLSSSDTTEGTVSPASVTFTSDNWNAPQTITLTGVDDEVADGAQMYELQTGVIASDDTRYAGLDPEDASVTNVDDDSPGFLVTPTTGLVTTEAGGQATFTIALASRPTADVQVALTSSDTGEGTVGPASLTFTADNWNAPQTVTVTGVDDAIEDGAQTYTIVTAAATSSDTGYQGLDPADVTVSNTDNDTAGITVAPATGLVTTESGGQATFTIVLNAQPTADVTIPLSSNDTTEGTLAVASVTFTAMNWNAPQAVTITGVDDAVADGNQPYAIVTGAATSTDTNYAGLDADDVAVTNTDNDSPGVTSTPLTGLQTTEAGGQATFTIVLNSQPTADVMFTVLSSDAGEGITDLTSVTFTSANWNAPQRVTITGQQDAVADGNQPYTIQIGAGTSADSGYAGLDPTDVAVTNIDDDSAGVLITPTSGLVTTEAGGTATFTIVLTSQPTADVSIALASSDVTEGLMSPVAVTFTTANWSAPQTITVTGVNDALADGAQPYQIITNVAISADPGYAGIDPVNVSLTNTDNDTAGITATPVSGLQTTEAGDQATFTIVLNSQPTDDVTIPVTSSDPGEGTVAPTSVTFTAANWNAPQTITVTGVDDATADGNQTFTIVTAPATSLDTGYAALDAANVAVTNIDNDSAGFLVTPVSGLVTNEAGGTATFTIVLTSQPTGTVTVALSSSDTTEGTVAPAALVFTTADWSAPQTVTVTGVDDAAADGLQPYTIVTAAATSTDASYNGLNPPDVAVGNSDNDSAGITVTPISGLQTSEGGGQATFSVVLDSMPSANVVINLTSSNTAEGTVGPAQLTFTPTNWAAPQFVTVTGADDAAADGNQLYTIVTGPATSADGGYQGLDAANVTVTNVDNDSAGFLVVPTVGLVTNEGGGQGTFTIRLTSQPSANVTVALTSSDVGEGTPSPASLTFTSTNWNAPQTVTVTGVNDDIADGNQPYTIITAAAVSSDPGYNNRTLPDVSVTNNDNDSAGITVTPTSPLVTTEAGGQATFTIVLSSQPTANVTIGLTSDKPGEGTVDSSSVVFTPINWSAPQTVTVTGVDDLIADGDQVFHVVTANAASTDTGYNGRSVADVTLTNTDNDSAGITVSQTSGLVTNEGGGQDTFTVVLNSQPTANVTIAVTSSDTGEGTVSPATLTFTTTNWNAPQTVTVTGVDDPMADGNQPYTVVLAAAVSADAGYNNVDPTDVQASNTDNDSAGITVTPIAGLQTSESGAFAQFSIVLTSQPSGSVTIPLSSSNTAEGTVAPASVTFTTANWNAAQTVTVTGVNDDVADGNQPYTIITGPATSSDAGYATRNADDVAVTNLDNDSAGILVSPTTGLMTSEDAGGTATFNIVLQSQPTANVTIPLASSDTTEGTVAPASITFTPANWNAPQTITVTGVDDAMADGAQPYTVFVQVASSADPNYNNVNPPNVSLTNVDNDSPGVTISPLAGLQTTESGGQTTFTVVLNSQPSADVTISLASSDATEGAVSTTSLTFTTANWNAEQTVTVTGLDDAIADGNQSYSIITGAASSSDAGYSGLTVLDVTVLNIDDDSAGIIVTPTSGLQTSENLDTAQFTIVLASQPTADVTIPVSSSDTTEGTLPFASVTFTAANWNLPQTVSITGVDDTATDGNQLYTIVTGPATSTDVGYDGLDAADVQVSNLDNDIPGFTIDPTGGLVVSEFLDTDTFTIVLNTQPTANVTIPLQSGDTTEGTVTPASVTFTPSNWNTPQTVTVTGVNDTLADGNITWFVITGVAASTDPNYNGLNPADVDVTTYDNDTPQVYVKAKKLLRTSENGNPSPTFSIRLTTMPSANVTCTFASSDTTEGTVAPTTITLTTGNWQVAQSVSVSGVDDAIIDGDQLFTIITNACTSTDSNYNGYNPRDLAALNRDND